MIAPLVDEISAEYGDRLRTVSFFLARFYFLEPAALCDLHNLGPSWLHLAAAETAAGCTR